MRLLGPLEELLKRNMKRKLKIRKYENPNYFFENTAVGRDLRRCCSEIGALTPGICGPGPRVYMAPGRIPDPGTVFEQFQ